MLKAYDNSIMLGQFCPLLPFSVIEYNEIEWLRIFR